MLGAEGGQGGLAPKVAAGMLAGALAAGISNPTDLVKTHMQKGGGASGGPFAVLARVVRQEGVQGLWVGTTPSMVSGLGRLRREAGKRWGGAVGFVGLGAQGSGLQGRVLDAGQWCAVQASAEGRSTGTAGGQCAGGETQQGYCLFRLPQARAALLTAAQCATYDELKLFFVRGWGWEDNLQTHFTGGARRGGMAHTVVMFISAAAPA